MPSLTTRQDRRRFKDCGKTHLRARLEVFLRVRCEKRMCLAMVRIVILGKTNREPRGSASLNCYLWNKHTHDAGDLPFTPSLPK
jgi:hypothetical protein